MFDINQYQLNKSILNQEDHVLELWYGKQKSDLIKLFRKLDIKVYTDTVDTILFYYKDNTPYIEYRINNNTLSCIIIDFPENNYDAELLISLFETLVNVKNVKYDFNFNNDIFKIIDLTNKVKTLEDCCNLSNINYQEFLDSIKNMKLVTQSFEKLILITQTLNEGWIPDWGNNNQYKYYPWFNMGGSSGVGFSYGDCGSLLSRSNVASCLCFKSRELCEYAGNRFLNYYKQYFLLNLK